MSEQDEAHEMTDREKPPQQLRYWVAFDEKLR
jgi:hypothetical protein